MKTKNYINRILCLALCAAILFSTFGICTLPVSAQGVATIGSTDYDSFDAALAAAQNGDVITLKQDVELSAGVKIDKTLTITGEGTVKVFASDTLTGSMFDVSGELTLVNVSVDGNGKALGTALITVNGGNLTMRDGVSVVNGTSGGVDIISGSFNFYGGSITGNKSDRPGNAVHMSDLGELRISGSASIGSASEIYIPSGSYFEISDQLTGSGTMKIRTDSVEQGSMIAMLGSAVELTEEQFSRFVITDGTKTMGISLEGTDIVMDPDALGSDTTVPDDTKDPSDTDSPSDTDDPAGTDGPDGKDYTVRIGSEKYKTLEEAFNSVSSGASATVTLLGDVTVDTAVTVNGNVTLEAEGNCTVNQGASLKGSMFTVAKDATLTVADSDNVITICGSGTDIGAALVDVKGTFKLGKSVTVSSNVNKTEKVNKGVIYVNGGTFDMTDGAVTGNDSKTGTVYIASGKVNLSGGGVYNNTASNAGGVYLASGALNLNGGSLYDNFADICGGVYVANGSFSFSNGSIYNNTGAKAGGVYVAAGSFDFSGGSIYDNSGESVWSAVDFSLSKTAAIHSSASYPGSIFLNGTAKIKVADSWKPAAAPQGYNNKIAVSVGDIKLSYVVAEFTSKAVIDNFVIGPKYEDKFVLIAKDKQIIVASNDKDCTVYWGNNAYKSINEALAELPAKAAATLTIVGDMAVSETALIKSGTNIIITVDVNPTDFKDYTTRTVKRAANFTGPVFTVEKGATLTLNTPDGKNLIFDGENKSVSGSMMVVSGGLSLGKGVTVKGNNNNASETIKSTHSTFTYGGGIYVDAGGNCTVNGGIITGNYASYGGGAYIKDGALTLGGGEISSNKAVYGGGVYIDTTGTDKNIYGALNMTNGKIASNQANATSVILESGAGGGVYIGNGSSFMMSGGVLSSNTAPIAAGVCVGTAVYTKNDNTPEPKFAISDKANISTKDTVHLSMIGHSYVLVTSALNSQSGSITLSIPTEMPQNMKLVKFTYGNNESVNADAADKALTKKLFALDKPVAEYFEISASQVDKSILVNTVGDDEPSRAKAGKHYNGLDRFVEGNSGRTEIVYGPVVLGLNESFTSYFNFSYYSNLYKNLNTYVTAAFPKGSRIVMIDTSDMEAVGYYYYEVTGEETVVTEPADSADAAKTLDTIEIPITSFCKMGTTDEYYTPILNPDSSKKALTTEKLLFVVDFTDVKAEEDIKYEGSYIMQLSHYYPGSTQEERYDISGNTLPVSYTIASTSASEIKLSNTENVLKVEYSMSADSAVITGNSGVIVFQLMDASFPAGTYLTDSQGVQYICPGESDSIAVPMPTDGSGNVMNLAAMEYTIANYYGAALVDVPIRAVVLESVNGTHYVAGALPEAASEGVRVTVSVEDEYSVLVTDIDSDSKPYYKNYGDLKELKSLKMTVKGLENAAETETFKLSLLKKKGKEYVSCKLSELFKVSDDYGEEVVLNTGNLSLDLNENIQGLMGNEYKIVFTVGDAVEYIKVNVTEEKK